VDVNLAWTITAFFLGAIVTRWNESRKHAAEVQADREERYEAMQRDTWVTLQDAVQQFSVEGHSPVVGARPPQQARGHNR